MKNVFLLIFFPFLIGTPALAKDPPTIRARMQDEFRQFPKMQMTDLYKFAYQAAMGNEHFMSDTAAIKKDLIEELASLDTNGNEPLAEYLTTDSAMARINLRPFKKMHADPSVLITAMMKTVKEIKPSVDVLRIFLSDIEKLADDDLIPFNVVEVQAYFKTMAMQNYPAIHHSSTYERAYKPAYRVVAGKFAQELQ